MVEKPQGNRPLGRRKCKWEDNIEIDLQGIEWGRGCGMDWSGSGEGHMVGTCEHGNESVGPVKCGEFLD